MIRLTVATGSAQRFQFAGSALWETVGSLAMLLRPDHVLHPSQRGWVQCTRRNLDPRLAGELPGALHALRLARMPDSRLPLPEPDGGPTKGRFERELAAMRDLAPTVVELDRACAVIDEYWRAAVAPIWPDLRDAVGDEVDHLRSVSSARGAAAALGTLRGRVAWRPPVLVAPFQGDAEHAIDGTLYLVPMAFAAGVRLFAVDGGTAALSYPSGRAALLGGASSSTTSTGTGRDAMSLLLGDGRAKVVRALETPATTTALATSIGLAKSTISQHLAVLHEARVVRRERSGTEVIYHLDHVGYALLRHLQNPTRPRPAVVAAPDPHLEQA